jgi:beta-lactamase class D
MMVPRAGVEAARPYGQWILSHISALCDAIRKLTVWFYQEMKQRIGQRRMQRYVNQSNYDNRNIGGGIDQFWLKGALRIGAKQQIDLLVKLYRSQLPFSTRSMNITKNILVVEKTDHYVIRAKTGWVGLGDKTMPQIGWWVGYVERDGKACFFAMNLDIKKGRRRGRAASN